MSARRLRVLVSLLCGLILVPEIAVVVWRLPRFAEHPLPYGDLINRVAVTERHVTNMVSAVNFDYRALDTVGEEFMLLAAVTGTLVLLRGRRGESVTDLPARVPGRSIPPRSPAVSLACRLLLPVTLCYGIYVILHAQLTPGGGFQGGAILGSGALLIYFGEDYGVWRRLARSQVFDALEALGALVMLIAGLVPVFQGAHFLQNTLSLGRTRALLSGGLILLQNAGVALAVSGGFVLLLMEFLEETRASREDLPK